MQENPVQFLGQGDLLEKGAATHSNILGLPWWLSWWRICLQCGRTWSDPWVGKIHWRRERRLTPVFLGFPGGSAGKQSACNAGDLGSIPGLGRSPGEGKGYPHQCSDLANSMACDASGGKEPACQCRSRKRGAFDPWVGKTPWRRAWQQTPVFLPGEFHAQRSLVGSV